MRILAIETTADLCSVAVCDDHGVLAERAFRHRMRLSERLMGDIDSALKDADLGVVGLDALAVGLGPGSFTGVRVGVTVVKTLADVLGKPVCGVNSLEATAERLRRGANRVLVPIVRARPGSLYAAFYRLDENLQELLELRPPTLYTHEELARELIEAQPCQVCGAGLAAAAPALRDLVGSSVSFAPVDAPCAADVAAIARRQIEQGKIQPAISLVPLYVAPPPIHARVASTGVRGDP